MVFLSNNFDYKSGAALEPEGYMTGKLLVAMPYIYDARFNHAVIYICGHDEQGAIGITTNKVFPSLTFSELLDQLNISSNTQAHETTLFYGGASELTRGFVLHSPDFQVESSVAINENFAITSTLEILRAIAVGRGPMNSIVSLGYNGWGPGQLEQEIQENVWMVVESDPNLVFNAPIDDKWRLSMKRIGVDPATLSIESGRA